MTIAKKQFLDLIENYNSSIWPMQIILLIIAAAAVLFIIDKKKNSDFIINIILAFLWIWAGVIYQLVFFVKIEPASYFFGVLFIMQGLLFIYEGFSKSKIEYGISKGMRTWAGATLILYALLMHPILENLMGYIYPVNITFGMPSLVTLFTFGILLLTTQGVGLHILVMPLIWSILHFSLTIKLGFQQDMLLLIVGLLGFLIVLINVIRETVPSEK